MTDMTIFEKKEVYIIVDYKLDEFIEKHLAIDFVSGLSKANGSSKMLEVSAENHVAEDLKDIENYVNAENPNDGLNDSILIRIMDYMCYKNIINPGTYIIDSKW